MLHVGLHSPESLLMLIHIFLHCLRTGENSYSKYKPGSFFRIIKRNKTHRVLLPNPHRSPRGPGSPFKADRSKNE